MLHAEHKQISAVLLAWSNLVANRLREVRMPPLGPRPYCFITFLYLTCKGSTLSAAWEPAAHPGCFSLSTPCL